MTHKDSLGRRLRHLRTDRGLSQKQLAEPRYTHAYVSSIEAGRRVPAGDALAFFAERLGVEPEELATGRPAGLQAELDMALVEAKRAVSAGRADEVAGTLDDIERRAAQYDMVRTVAKVHELRGLGEELAGNSTQAMAHYDAALETLVGEPVYLTAAAISGKARCLNNTGDPHHAIYLLESTLDRMRRDGFEEPGALVRLNAMLVMPLLATGARTKAAAAAEVALKHASHSDDPSTIATLHMNVARMHVDRREFDDAEVAVREAQRVLREAELDAQLGMAHVAMGYVASRNGALDLARSELEEAVELLDSSASRSEIANAKSELARVHRLSDEIDRARDLLDEVIDEPDDVAPTVLAWALRERAMTTLETDTASAESDARRAIELFETGKQILEMASGYRVLGDVLAAQGRDDDGTAAYRRGLGAVEEVI